MLSLINIGSRKRLVIIGHKNIRTYMKLVLVHTCIRASSKNNSTVVLMSIYFLTLPVFTLYNPAKAQGSFNI